MVDVMEKNNNLFGIYMKRLRVYDERWQGFAQRLVTWMNSDKAYYPEARPKILNLLGTAYMTLRTELGVPNHNTPLDLRPLSSENAMVKVYFALVETLSRFRELYTEPHLLGRVNFLIASIRGPHPTPQPTPVIMLPTSLTPVLPPQESVQRQPAHPQSTAQPPKKKKIQLDFDAIVRKDMPSQGLAQSTRPLKTGNIIDLTLDEPEPTHSLDNEIVEITSSTLEKRTPTLSIPVDDVVNNSTTSLLTEQSNARLDIRVPQLPLSSSADLKATVNESLHPPKIEDTTRHHSPGLRTSLHANAAAVPSPPSSTLISLDEVLMANAIPAEDIERNEVQDIVMGSVEEAISSSEHVDISASLTESTKTTLAQSVVQMQGDVPSSEQHDASVILPMSTDEDLQNVLSTRSSSPDTMLTLQKTPVEVTVHNTQDSEQYRVDLCMEYCVPEEIQLPIDGGFGKEMRIIAYGRGHSVSQVEPLTFTININPQQFKALSRWNERSESICNSICVSLACYLCDDLKKINFLDHNTEAFNAVHSSWPSDNHLVLHTSFCGKQVSLPLSPPIMTINGLLDLGPFLICGHNNLSLHHQSDLTKYFFVLHSHHPTKAHLEPVALQRKQQLSWKKWSAEVVRPLELLASPFSNV